MNPNIQGPKNKLFKIYICCDVEAVTKLVIAITVFMIVIQMLNG